MEELEKEEPREHHTPYNRAPSLLFQQFLANPKAVSYLQPSSKAVERRLSRVCEPHASEVLVELGPGTGGTTQELLRHLPSSAKLLAIELNPQFARHIQEQITDPRLILEVGCATDLGDMLTRHGLGEPDAVVSGIPFSCLPGETGRQILTTVRDALAPKGRFVAYQVRSTVATLANQVFGHPPNRSETEFLNFPPIQFFRWDKP